jgi:hypothetical protein
MIMKDGKYFAFRLVIILTLTCLTVFAQSQTQVREETSRLVVSFYSICCGIDRQAQEKLDKFINTYEKAKGKQLTRSAVHWGREGEIDYCLKLSELSPRQQRKFISKVRSLLKSSKLVHINENTACKRER